MKRSTDRILTTHVGSLPRPAKLFAMMKEKQEGRPLDPSALATEVRDAVAETVRKQVETGLDIICDGEMGKVGFIPYVNDRWLGGTLTNFATIRSRLGRLEELEGILKSEKIAGYSKKMQSSLNRAIELAEYALMYDNPGELNTRYQRLDKITAADVQRVAKQYLTKENRSVVVTNPKPAAGRGGL